MPRVARTVTMVGTGVVAPNTPCPGPCTIPRTVIGVLDNIHAWKAHTVQVVINLQFLNNSINNNIATAVAIDLYSSGRPLLTTTLQRVSNFQSDGFGASVSQWTTTVNLPNPEEMFMGDEIAMTTQVTAGDTNVADNFTAQLLGVYAFGLSTPFFGGIPPTSVTLIGDEIPRGPTVNVLG